ncbi:hypothetical protein SAMD00019534_105080 [Acytostelium subglobosum LB1]|uniref:hypothetical protein n=1 Tax=Acytostelium subglobosum LB1 TaxID=1410327 RepID=UPI000644AB1B|nr:hypothetical protein SAMD00019534_105080 [Acytostelium subglobosum LB1]GAM27333.1 hypothetical protein SAMD00019534_105080 [Acytostelium subglobosum LB1]|eukprot:XP_012749800.1 hypothetical protein SAMD00019534_105080 [Acytostelium subglobosum LB1]
MNSLIRRVEKIQRETVDAKDKNKELLKEGDVDAFTLLRKKIGLDIKGIKELIKERDEAEINMPGSVRTVELSHHIRKAIMDIKGEAQKLQRMYDKAQDKYTKKNKENAEKQQRLELDKEVCELVWNHIKELELLNKKRGGDRNAFIPIDPSAATIKELPDIDNDDFRELRRNDQEIDRNLEIIQTHLVETHNIAQNMGSAAKRQGKMLDDLNDRADVLDEKLENINVRLGQMIKDVRKADRFILDVILLCVLLGIGGLIYSFVK